MMAVTQLAFIVSQRRAEKASGRPRKASKCKGVRRHIFKSTRPQGAATFDEPAKDYIISENAANVTATLYIRSKLGYGGSNPRPFVPLNSGC